MGGGIQFLEVYFKGKKGVGMFKLQGEQLGQAWRAKDIDGGGALLQVHGREQAEEAEEMIAMQVTDKDITNALMLYFVTHQLHLCTFAAINQVELITDGENLGGMVAVCRRGCRRTA